MALHVFPPTVTQPRKSSLKKPKTIDTAGAAGELKGVAFQVNSSRNSGVVQPADEQIKHSLFCDPSTAKTSASTRGSLRRHQRARKRTSTSSENTLIDCETPEVEEDQLSPLPENTHFGSSPSSQTRLTPGTERPTLLTAISNEAQAGSMTPASPGGDRLSPLPDRQRFDSPMSPGKSEFPISRSLRSTSPTLVQEESPATTVPPYSPAYPPPARSMFPQYDPTKSLNNQHYFPTARSQTPTLPREKVSKSSSSNEKKNFLQPLDLQRIEHTGAVVDGYEHIPIADNTDLHAVSNASCGKFPIAGRKALFRLIQPREQGTSLAVGTSPDSLLYTMSKSSEQTSSTGTKASDQLVIAKHSDQQPGSCTVAQVALPNADKSDNPRDEVVGIFPQMAAINAVETVANSAAASEIAMRDPTAASPEAARLAQDAVSEAHRRFGSQLVRSTRKRDSLGAVTATYQLEHPTLGSCAITVTRSTAVRHARDPRAKISLHHPSATEAAVSAETLVLAFLDFARDAFVLDTPGLLALEGSYIIDTVVCALLAVAVIENDALKAETLTFEAPPKSPLPPSKRQASSSATGSGESIKSKRSSRFLGRNKKKKVEEKEQIDLPVVAQGALALLGLSFKVAVWTLEVGVKVAAGVVIGTSHMVTKGHD